MFSGFNLLNSSSIMEGSGVSNSDMFFPDNQQDLEFNFLVPLQLDGSNDQDDGQKEVQQQQQERVRLKILVSSLEIKLASPLQEDVDGIKTPTSMDHKIPVIHQCPPAPKKPKSLPSRKRKFRTLLDLSKEVESLFPPAVIGSKMKKLRQDS